ncbi:hypothetical protein [Aneurinibacillus migulanus]|nr:hypothetical protein [Aneurinibacillus migulanus]MCP1354637.1 hypothetical protein [Aneurinibacillus migulanus]
MTKFFIVFCVVTAIFQSVVGNEGLGITFAILVLVAKLNEIQETIKEAM